MSGVEEEAGSGFLAAGTSGRGSGTGCEKGKEKEKDPSLSYRYWVGQRGDGKEAVAPPPQPKRLSKEEAASFHKSPSQGSLWNQGGTWEERSLNDWAKATMKEVMSFSCPLHLDLPGPQGAVVPSTFHTQLDLDSLSGDTTLVVVRNKKRHGYMLDINLKFAGVCQAGSERRLEGTMRIQEATYGDIDGISVEVCVEGSKAGVEEGFKSVVESEIARQVLPLLKPQLRIFEERLVEH